MIHLRLRTEFSHGRGYGKISEVLDALDPQTKAAAITDNSCWGHFQWGKQCRERGIKPIFGAEFAVVPDASVREGKVFPVHMAVLAKNADGLGDIYRLIEETYEHFYYFPRIDYSHIRAVHDRGNTVVLSGAGCDVAEAPPAGESFYLEVNPEDPAWNRQAHALASDSGFGMVACASNNYPTPEHRSAYQVVAGRNRTSRAGIQHIPDVYGLKASLGDSVPESAYELTEIIGLQEIEDVEIPMASMATADWPKSLEELCREGIVAREMEWTDEYEARLRRELDLILEKDFADYFYLVADMVAFAKRHMVVGPARGSSAGSIVCYLMGITDVDPILHGLLFERFIDLNREDLPDIDIDFEDTSRELVIQYLRDTYGQDHVRKIGTTLRFKAKSALRKVGVELKIPQWEIEPVAEAVIERSGGDARAEFCVADALTSLDIGKDLVKKYPHVLVAGEIEGHAKTSGTHAAGILVCNEPLWRYCATGKEGTAQIDKGDAERLGMLKIDCLGLRTLTIMADCLKQIGKPYQWLLDYPLDDQEAFKIFNDDRMSGIFQFEGYALKILTRQMGVEDFNDVAVITALARPGPLHCGATNDYVARRTGKDKPTPVHPAVEHITIDTFGTIVYQEQVMAISRELGQMSWEDVSNLRKAMSKSLGEEWFNQYWEKFREGATKVHSLNVIEARAIWDSMCTFGSWAFNKSHAVSYGLLSYWCSVLKAHFPMEFAAANLTHQKDPDKCIRMLQDVIREGYSFKPFDPDYSEYGWKVVDGALVGGLENIKGIGPKKAEAIIASRVKGGKPMTPSMKKMLAVGNTPYDDVFACENRFKDMYENPEKYKIMSGRPWDIQKIQDPGEYVFIGRIKVINLRDKNEHHALMKRGGRRIKRFALFLNLMVEDDTGSIMIQIPARKYPKLGKPIVEGSVKGDWLLVKGRIEKQKDGKNWRIIKVSQLRKLPQEGVSAA